MEGAAAFSPADLLSLAASGDRDAVLELLDGGEVDAEELNRKDSNGLTPLHSAIQGCGPSYSSLEWCLTGVSTGCLI